MHRHSLALLAVLATAGCPCNAIPNLGDGGSPDGGDAGPVFVPDGGFCSLPGSVVYSDKGTSIVPGATVTSPSFDWLTLPAGFCVHHYATVGNARQLRFAPGGELFVASPTTPTTGGGSSGLAAIVVIPDDNHDGFGDSVITFLAGMPSTQGLLFANGNLYYQSATAIVSEPYMTGQRQDNGQSTVQVDITVYTSSLHWPKTLDISDTGQIFVGNGGDQGEQCVQPMPFHGGILQIDGSAGGAEVAMGLRNPIAVKCHRDGNNHCFASELALDYSANAGGREKLIPIESGDNWGFPCCATANAPYASVSPTPDCSGITPEANSFLIGNTPFGFDFVDGQFPSPWDHRIYVALHGAAGSWAGARIVSIAFDPSTDLPEPSSTLDGGDSGNIADFATGWDDNTRTHGRPADVTVAADGRVFIADDNLGEIFWVAPIGG